MNNPPRRDEELVILAQRGDESAIRELVRRHEDRVYTLALRMLRDHAEAEDVLQETFISMLNGLENFRADSAFSTWLYRIAFNATLMKLRRKHVTVSIEETVDNEDAPMPRELFDWSQNPELATMQRETKEQLDAAVTELPEGLRAVFVLRDVNGMSTEETASILGISPQNVKTRLHRARMALRETLSHYFVEPAAAEEVEP